MKHALQSVITSSFFVSLVFLPTLAPAAESADQSRANPETNARYQGMTDDPQWRTQTSNPSSGFQTQPNYSQGNWNQQSSNQNWTDNQRTYSRANWGDRQGTAYGRQGLETGQQYYSQGQKGWSGQPTSRNIRMEAWSQNYANRNDRTYPAQPYYSSGGSSGYFQSNPSHTYYGAGMDRDGDGRIDEGQNIYSFSPSHYGRSYYSSYHNPSSYHTYSYPNYSYGTPSYSSGYSSYGDDNSYPYSQYYQDDNGMGDGFYYNVR